MAETGTRRRYAGAVERARAPHGHGWIGTERVETRLGGFDFVNGYPARDAPSRLREVLVFNRAVEVYLAQMPIVSWLHVWRGVAEAGVADPNQVVIWEHLMDAETLLLTGNTETVYGLASLDLERDGPVVIETPPSMFGSISDLRQVALADIGATGVDRGEGGRFLVVPPGHDAPVPEGYLVLRSPTFRIMLGVRGFQAEGGTAKPVDLIRTTRIHPLARAADPPPTTFFDASQQPVDTLFDDDGRFFDDLAALVEYEPQELFSSEERFHLATIGIEKGKAYLPDGERRRLLDEAARLGSAIARANSFASDDPERLAYRDRRWEWAFVGRSATWDAQGYVNTDRRAAFAYIALGMSPAMVEKHVGAGSQYLWTPRDGDGAFLDGARAYRLRLPPSIPAKLFWSVVAYDADSRSLLRNEQPFPSVSSYTDPAIDPDGSIDVWFGPGTPAAGSRNWIQTVPGNGWFVLLRLYGPLEAFFDGRWKPGDVEPAS